MAIKRCESSIDVVKAAKIRIRNVFQNGLPVYMSFSGGKDSLCMAQLVMELVQAGEINPAQAICFISYGYGYSEWKGGGNERKEGITLTIRDIAVAFGIEVDQKSVSAAESAIKGVKNMASKLLGAIGIGFSIAGIANLAEAAADAEALKSQFSQVFGDLEQDASDKLDKIADETGVTVNRMKGSFTQIAAFAKTTGMEQADARPSR